MQQKEQYQIENDPLHTVGRLLFRLTIDPFVLMIALGALSHRLQHPQALSVFLGQFDFWTCLLVVVALQAVSPDMSVGKLIMKARGAK